MAGFQKAVKKRVWLKLAITGASGSGKTYSALRLAHGMGKKVAMIDTENGSASLYADRFEFDTLDLTPPYEFGKFVDAINQAVAAGYEVIIIDSASHFWEGILEYKGKLDARGGNSYTNWNEAGEHFKDILSAVLQSPIHVIACMRSKIDYVLEDNERGKKTPRKVGLAPIMRDGIEYEFTTVFDVDMSHNAAASKDRTGLFADKIAQITEDTGKRLMAWRDSGEAVSESTPEPDERGELIASMKQAATAVPRIYKPELAKTGKKSAMELTVEELRKLKANINAACDAAQNEGNA